MSPTAEPTRLRLTAHAIQRFQQRINAHATPRQIAQLASDARPPTTDEWKAIHRGTRCHGKGRTPRQRVRVLGTLVFVLDQDVVVTCWRMGE